LSFHIRDVDISLQTRQKENNNYMQESKIYHEIKKNPGLEEKSVLPLDHEDSQVLNSIKLRLIREKSSRQIIEDQRIIIDIQKLRNNFKDLFKMKLH